MDKRGDLDWFVNDSDPMADVALIPVFLNDKLVEYKTIGVDTFATKSFIETQHVNENDEVLFTGLFTGFVGALKNYPIVRHGHLALIPGEDVVLDKTQPDKKTQIYLAEVTSFGGNSGSPVFLRIGVMREGVNINLNLSYNYYLLGVMKGYFPDQTANQNSGIAIIVPSEKIDEILSGDRVKALVARGIADTKASQRDFDGSDAKFKEAISILDKVAPESSQLAATLSDYAAVLGQQNSRTLEAAATLARAQAIADKPVTKPAEP